MLHLVDKSPCLYKFPHHLFSPYHLFFEENVYLVESPWSGFCKLCPNNIFKYISPFPVLPLNCDLEVCLGSGSIFQKDYFIGAGPFFFQEASHVPLSLLWWWLLSRTIISLRCYSHFIIPSLFISQYFYTRNFPSPNISLSQNGVHRRKGRTQAWCFRFTSYMFSSETQGLPIFSACWKWAQPVEFSPARAT